MHVHNPIVVVQMCVSPTRAEGLPLATKRSRKWW